jgi:epoxyqueuosine reductase
MLDSAAIKALAIERARALGAGDVRVVAAREDAQSRERMQASFARGDLATWGYDDAYAHKAASPEQALAGARSVICIAVPYATPEPARPPMHGRVSNYAWSEDYHRRLRALLADVAETIDRAAGGAVTAVACDTKPIAERAFAARAGLGWIGKHTSLISPGLGSFVFLGEIITTLELEPDLPLRKSCGTCERCVQACPTDALRGDYTIDATRCIADLTQRTDPIPREMRALLGDWLWGCDICQIVCPPTQKAGKQASAAFAPLDAQSGAPALTELLQLRSGEFKRRYARTAMGWRGAAVLRRNAAIALGNALDRAAIPALHRALARDGHPMVRGAAAWALGRIGAPNALRSLREQAHTETDPTVQEEIAFALKPFVCLLALLLAFVPQRTPANDDLLARVAAINPGLHSYSATMHAHIALTTFPFLSTNLVATYYHKDPDLSKVDITSGLPLVAEGFSTLYPHIEPASRWNEFYMLSKTADDGRVASYALVPRKPGNVARIEVKIDEASATVRSMRWDYGNGGWASMEDTYALVQGDTVVTSQTGHVDEPNYKGDITTTFSNYQLNPSLPDSLFTQ